MQSQPTSTLSPQRAVVLLSVLVLALLWPHAGAEAQTPVTKDRFGGLVVSGSTTTFDECVYSMVSVFGDRKSVRYSAYSSNQCDGTESFVTGEATPTTFVPHGRLASVRVVATIPLRDGSEALTGDVFNLNETFSATGPADFTHWSEVQREGSRYKMITQGAATVRSAVGTGTVQLADAYISRGTSLFVEIARI
jgi:hypothetical protein